MLALRRSSERQALWQGLAAGMVMGVFGFYWLMNMLKMFSGFPSYLCALFMLIVCAYQAGRYSLLGWLYVRAQARGWPPGLVFCLAFAASETLYPMLFPFSFSATMHEVYPLVQVAEWGGPILVSLTIVAPAWGLSLVLERWLENRIEGRSSLREAFVETGVLRWSLWCAVPLLSLVYGMVRIVQVDQAVEAAEKIKVGLVQANMSLVDKRLDRAEGLARHTRMTKRLRKKEQAELVVWSETSVAGAVYEQDAAEAYRSQVTRQLKVPAIVGAILARDVDDSRGQVMFNTALLADRKGHIVGRYDKQYLLAFGEYLPLGDQFPILYEWSPNSSRFTKGTSFEPLTLDGHDIATFICYEDIVPHFVNRIMNQGAPEMMVNLTNDAWFGDSTEPWEHMALSKMRAVEQRRYLVRSTNSGVSGFVDPVGRLVSHTQTFEQAAIAEQLAWLKIWSPYRIWGESPWWVASLVGLAMSLFARPKGSPASSDESLASGGEAPPLSSSRQDSGPETT